MASFYDINFAPFVPIGYEISKYINAESNSLLFEVKCISENKYELLKVINVAKRSNEYIAKYISIINYLQDIECDNIIKYTSITSDDKYLAVTMKDYPYSLQNINVFSYFENTGIYELLMEMTSAIKVLHNYDIVHSDIKPSNILITRDEHFILADYYMYKLFNPSLTISSLSLTSVHYLSPETIQNSEITSVSDMWSLGAVIYYLYKSYPPFEGKTIFQVMKNICICNYKQLKRNKNGNDLINQILENLLNIKKENRYTITQLIEVLSKYDREEFFPCQDNNENKKNEGGEEKKEEDDDEFELNKNTIEIINKRIDIFKNNLSSGLIFSFDLIGDNGIRYLTDKFETMENLTKLILRSNKITDTGLKVITYHLRFIPQLSILNLSANSITEKGIEVFCRKLQEIKLLKKLDLSFNSINDNGIDYLTSSIYKCSQLEDLNVMSILQVLFCKIDNCISNIDVAKGNILSAHPNKSLNLLI